MARRTISYEDPTAAKRFVADRATSTIGPGPRREQTPTVAMGGVRRKSRGVCIGWFTGVLAHFRLDWGCTVQWKGCGASRAGFALGWFTGVLAHFRLDWGCTVPWKGCGASRPVFALVGSPECLRTSAWIGIGYFNSIRSNRRFRSSTLCSHLATEHCWDEHKRRLASQLGSRLGSQRRHR